MDSRSARPLGRWLRLRLAIAALAVLCLGLMVGLPAAPTASPASIVRSGRPFIPDSPSTSPWIGWNVPSLPRHAFKVTTQSRLIRLFRSCPVPGAVYDATRLTATFTNRTVIKAQCPNGRPQTIFLGPNVRFTGALVDTNPAVDVTAAQNIVIYGGDVSNPLRGAGVNVRGHAGEATRNLRWWGFRIHDTAQHGLLVHQLAGSVTGVDLRGDISTWSLNLSLDPHEAKGTGLHGAYIGVTSSSGSVANSTFVLDVHDAQYGSGVQLGPNLQNDTVQVRAANLSCNPPQGADGTCGNALALFGGGQSNVQISDVEASDVRRVVEASGLDSLPTGTFTVSYGRGTNVRLSPAYNGTSVVYTNVQ